MKRLHLILITGVFALFGGLALADHHGGGKKDVVIEDPLTFCDHWKTGFGTNPLYQGDGFINEVRWIGRYHGQFWSADSDRDEDSDYQHRRWRFGVQIDFLDDFTFEGQFNLKTNFDNSGRFVRNVEDLTIKYDPEGAGWDLTVGKQKAWLSREWNTSSKRIKTMERSILANNIVPTKIGGVILGLDEVGPLVDVKVGLFSGTLDDDWSTPTVDGGLGANFSATYELSEITDVRFDYLWTDNDSDANAFEGFENAFSLNTKTDFNDRLTLETDVLYGLGHTGQSSDLFGVVIMPYYDITDDLEFVFRYTYATADDAGGINVQSRYERAVGGRLAGDEYHAFYLGLNYYICGDRLKLMGGVEFSDLEGQDSNSYTTWWSGVRLYF